jgi:hypothetical protein
VTVDAAHRAVHRTKVSLTLACPDGARRRGSGEGITGSGMDLCCRVITSLAYLLLHLLPLLGGRRD